MLDAASQAEVSERNDRAHEVELEFPPSSPLWTPVRRRRHGTTLPLRSEWARQRPGQAGTGPLCRLQISLAPIKVIAFYTSRSGRL
jgi:hypothetical protein